MRLPDKLIVIGTIENDDADTFELTFFVRDEGAYVPVFSSWEEFERETAGTEYLHQAIAIDTRLLGAVLTTDHPVILDPLSGGARLIEKSELIGITG